jgi:S-adenosylmethionine-dependent methyltransferase
MGRNHWVDHAQALAAAFLQGDGGLHYAVVTRALQRHLQAIGHGPETPARVLDVGGGQALQAIALARHGHHVTVLDLDDTMLAAAHVTLAREEAAIRDRITLRRGAGEDAPALAGKGYDLVCCHSVLMYLDDPAPLLDALVTCARPGGLISVLSLNADAVAMRAGLQGRWHEAVQSLQLGRETGAAYLPTQEPPLRDVRGWLETRGAAMQAWYGVGIFTDHHDGPIVCTDPALVIEAEWRAGMADPYRGVARCFHLVTQRAPMTSRTGFPPVQVELRPLSAQS